MAANYKVLSDFEVATAEEAQGYFMDQSVVKVDADVDLDTLPTSVKTAYVLNTGIAMARDNTNAWKPLGGAAAVSTTAPSNPQVGALWVNPDDVFPVPVRVNMGSRSTLLGTSYANVSGTNSASITVSRACVVRVAAAGYIKLGGSSTCDMSIRMNITGAITTDSYTQSGSNGVMYQWANGTSIMYNTQHMGFTIAVPAGTTNFVMQAMKSAAATTTEINNLWVEVAPIAWADEYAAGVA